MSYKPKILEVAAGGTGVSTLTGILTGNGTNAITASTVTQNGVLYGGASNAVSSLAVAATGTVLTGTGGTPAFSATPSVTSITLSSGTALSNYVESTFTPTITGSGSNPTVGYTTQIGRYTRIGNQVIFNITVVVSSYSGGTGDVQVSSLPITASANAIAVGACYLDNITFVSNYISPSVVASSTNLKLISTTTAAASAPLSVTALGSTSQIRLTGTYEV